MGHKNQGFTLVGVLVTITILMVVVTFLGRMVPLLTRFRMRSESKASFTKSVGGVNQLVARRVNQVLSASCPVDADDFMNRFNSAPPVFAGTDVSLRIERQGGPNLAKVSLPSVGGFCPNWQADLSGCKNSDSVKVASAGVGLPLLFCAAKQGPDPLTPIDSLSDFTGAQAAFVLVRAELFSAESSQNDKVVGNSISCNSFRGFPNEKRQIKLTLRAYWKRKSDVSSDLDFFCSDSSALLSVDEIQ
ncbi:hypothetical protein EBT16_02665 [bacterium]|nr:hypothetical protein [bacterium]